MMESFLFADGLIYANSSQTFTSQKEITIFFMEEKQLGGLWVMFILLYECRVDE